MQFHARTRRDEPPRTRVRDGFGRSLLLGIAAVVCACSWSACGSRADAQVISGTFAGPILAGNTATLVNGASIVGNISNDGTLEFALTDPLTNTFSISGTGNVLLSNTGTVTFSAGNSYSNGTTIKFGELVIVTGGTISHPAADMTVGDLSGDDGFLTISGGSVTTYNSTLGYNGGSAGTAEMSAGTWTISASPGSPLPDGDLNIGYAGTGSLNMTGGTIDVAGSAHVARDVGSLGLFTMSGGTMSVGSAFQVGDGGEGTFSLTGGLVTSDLGYIGNNPTGSGTATITSGTWRMTGDLKVGFNDGTGSLSIGSGGVVVVGGDLSVDPTKGTLNLNSGGTLSIGDGGTTGSIDTAVTNDGTLVFNRSTNYTYALAISGTGDVIKRGDGTLTLNQTNSYSGGTTILGGTIAVGSAGSIDHASAAVEIGSSTGDVGGLAVIGGTVNASTIDLFNGTLSIANDGGQSGTVTTGTATLGNAGTGTATMELSTWTVTNGMTIGVNSGTGQLNVGNNSFLTTGVVGGLGGNTTLGAAAGDSGTVTVSDFGVWSNYGNLVVGDGGTGHLEISSNGQVLVTGTLSQGASGTIVVNTTGTLLIGDGGTTGTLTASTLTNDGSIVFNRSTDTSTAAAISGAGSLTKLNTNTLTLTGSSSYTGPTNLDQGSLYVNGQLGDTQLIGQPGTLLGGSGTIGGVVTMFSGTLAPGSAPDTIGSLTVGGLAMDTFGETETAKMTTFLSITGTTAGVDYDQFVGAVGGSSPLTYAGTLNLTITGTDFYPNFTTFNLFSNFSSTGDSNFSELVLNANGTSYEGLQFTYDAVAQVWTTPQPQDPSGYGQYLVFNPGTGDLVVVPEPGTMALAATGVAFIFGAARWRRRRSGQTSSSAPIGGV